MSPVSSLILISSFLRARTSTLRLLPRASCVMSMSFAFSE